MSSTFIFLVDLAWKSRFAIPMFAATILLLTGLQLQIDISFISHQEELQDNQEDPASRDETHDGVDANARSLTNNITLTDIAPTSDLEANTEYVCSSTSSSSYDDAISSPASNAITQD